MDVFDAKKRSLVMAGIKSKNTKPEITIRKLLHKNGYRFRLHQKRIPGNPDIVLKKHGIIIFVNGCFWHKHDCEMFIFPKSRKKFWKNKLDRNYENDLKNHKLALKDGWRVVIIWECALRGRIKLPMDKIESRLNKFITSDRKNMTIRGKH